MEGYLRAEISVAAIQHNLSLVRSLIGPGVKICPVVKANAYGHGMRQVLPLLGAAADMLGVATCSEAVQLRQLGWQRPILMFTSAAASGVNDLAELIVDDVTLTVTSLDELDLLEEATERARRPANVHIKVDTGMGRSGALPEDATALATVVRKTGFIRLTGMYTHFACAEDPDKAATLAQFARFIDTVDRCGGRGELTLHSANSAAVIDLPQTHLDMCRPGMALYGYQPGESLHRRLPLQPCLRLTAPVVLIKDVPGGSFTGYGLTYRFPNAARIALVPIGYADGYFRSLSNVAVMRVAGVNCPVRGRISMDQTIIEITGLPTVHPGQIVEIISPDPAQPNSVESLARLAGTIPYEIVTRLGDRITRTTIGAF